MALKLIKPEDRIIFLRKFTAALLLNSKSEEERKKLIEVEKLRQKFIAPLESPEQAIGKAFMPSIQEKKQLETQIIIPVKPLEPKQFISSPIIEKRKPIFHRIKQSITPHPDIQRPRQFMKSPAMIPSQKLVKEMSPQMQTLKEIQPVAQPRPTDFNLGKMEQLLKDQKIQSIECSGPGKNVLVKKNNRVNTTEFSLTQEEITEIINEFSRQARIPITGGILKAAVGDLVISAIISEFVGSRFIINRILGYQKIR
ncbi:MAG: hypothetical protein WC438_03765 [Candidatus Pacearchaeota archaeon]